MNLAMLWDNVVAYSLQIGLLVALAAIAPAALRLKMPRARLLYWQILLGAILLLPLLRPPQPQVATGTVQVTTTAMTIVTHPTSKPFPLSRTQAALLLLAAGAFCRLIWLAIGLGRLSRYRRHSMPLAPASSWSAEADLRIAPEISSPVTFGFLHPVVLLPPQFPELDSAKQDAILCHEVLHVRRRDWLFTLAEELVRAVFWFHPAIWWLLGEIQLAREQAVDREVIEMTNATDEYVDALLAIAGAHPQLDLAPAPLFLRKRHLKQRVVSILKEVRMSKKRWITSLTLATGMLAAACWFVTAAFPLAAAPQTVTDGPGVTVDTNGAPLMHRSGVFYPFDARAKGIQGTVVVQVKLDSKGEVADVSVMSGPEELRRAAIQSVLSWHFAKETAGSTRQVSITFVPPKEDASAPRKGVSGGVPGGVIGGIIDSVPGGVPSGVTRVGATPPVSPSGPVTVRNIEVLGFSDQVRNELLSQLPIHAGDELTLDRSSKLHHAVNEFDPHAMVMLSKASPTETDVIIRAPGSVVGPITSSSSVVASNLPVPPGTIRVGGNVQQAMLVEQPHPIYPELAKQARISGVVTLNAIIGKDGHVENLTVMKGHPLLVQAALEAVKNWVYKVTLLNGQPVQVQTTIDVNFTLSE
jgi:TonB family protein